ncbi:MAG: hypothetical protein E7324_04680 [Clostridiales bacterium]|nr:hypothetical protein [Clostridiales bacterium]
MQPSEMERSILSLHTQITALRRDMKTAFRRIDEQTRLTDTVHQLALSIRDLANKQENTQQQMGALRQDVDDLKGRSGKRWDLMVMEIIKYVALTAAGYLIAHLF